ncbi:MAG: hypothetical protein ACRD3W_23970, partial [Terriglobales bacterium]
AQLVAPALADQTQAKVSQAKQVAAQTQPGESTANTQTLPTQILKTGINLDATTVSPNSMQLSNTIGLTPLLERMQSLRARVESAGAGSLEGVTARQDLLETRQQAALLIQRTGLEIDFATAEIMAEQNVYSEILSTFSGDRDKLVARVNAASFISNGILWAAAEAFDIPSFAVAKWAIPSGTTGIAAGLVPSFASMYTLKAVNGKKKTSEVEPNMLAKLFGYPVVADIEYPKSVWEFLNQVPASEPSGKKRLDQLVDRWISDSNIPSFTDRASRSQLDVITASASQKKGLSIATLGVRQVMLTQLAAEIQKMKRMLLELSMVATGEKQLVANAGGSPRIGIEPDHRLISEKPANCVLEGRKPVGVDYLLGRSLQPESVP